MSAHSSAGSQAPSGPPLWLAALAAALALAGALLGDWQLDRAAANRELRERFVAASALPVERVGVVPPTLDPEMRYRRVEVVGAYVPERQFLLDNRVRNREVGYEVLTALSPSAGGPWLLVNRGWVRADPDRSVLPAIDVGGGERIIVGLLDQLPRAGLALGQAPANALAPATVLSYPTAAEIETLLGRPLANFQLLLEPTDPDGYARTRDLPGLGPERNVAYAGQWFALAALSAVGALWVIIAAARRRKR